VLTHDDLNKLADRIEARVDKRCDGIDERLDRQNGRLRKSESEIAVLWDRTLQAKQEGGAAGKNSGAKWGAGAGAMIGGAILAIYKILSDQP
jgi:hypothetical protein